MQRTQTNQRRLRDMMVARGCYVSIGHLSDILSGSRRPSLVKAMTLHEITGVPVKSIARWPKVPMSRTIRALAKAAEAIY